MFAFIEKLADWLVWYNYQRPHHSLGQTPPVTILIQYQPECNMWWTHTVVSNLANCHIQYRT
ncbi:MAG: integrase core domain-containing protein [Gammaproteobacteria bacterium]